MTLYVSLRKALETWSNMYDIRLMTPAGKCYLWTNAPTLEEAQSIARNWRQRLTDASGSADWRGGGTWSRGRRGRRQRAD